MILLGQNKPHNINLTKSASGENMYQNPVHPQYFRRSFDDFGGKISFIVTDLIQRLREMNGQNTEGIFRISGATRDISELCLELDSGRVSDWTKYANVHTISCALKKYFRDMVQTNPLLPTEFYDEFVQIPIETKTNDEAVAKFREIIGKLTKARKITFSFLFQYLFEITQSPTSKMNANNLSIVFSPNLLYSKDINSPDLKIKYNSLQNKAVAMVIENYDKIFIDIDVNERCFITDDDMNVIKIPPFSENDIKKLGELRRESLIPFIPNSLLNSQSLIRPTRTVDVPKE